MSQYCAVLSGSLGSGQGLGLFWNKVVRMGSEVWWLSKHGTEEEDTALVARFGTEGLCVFVFESTTFTTAKILFSFLLATAPLLTVPL